MVGDKTLYRSRDSVVGGVCAGLADYFDLDAVIVRTLAIVLALVTSGGVALLYAALWAILPKEPPRESMVDVAPESIHSEAHGGRVDASVAAGAASPTGTVPPGHAGAGHVPPVPPAAQASAAGASGPHAASAPSGAAAPRPAAARPVADGSVRAMLLIGVVLLFAGSSAAFAGAVREVRWFQFWPLLLAIGGIVLAVLPARGPVHRCWMVAAGLVSFSAGAFLLAFSLGLASWGSLFAVGGNLWPLLSIMLGFFLMARSVDVPALALCGAVAFAAFCVLGLAWFAAPGALDHLTLQPFGKVYVLTNPWA